MAHPHQIKLTDKKSLRWNLLAFNSDPLPEFWETIETLPDVIDGKDYKEIIKILFKRDGMPNFTDYDELATKLGKKLTKKEKQEAFQIWHNAMRIIRVRVSNQIRVNRLKRSRDERKERIRRDKEERHRISLERRTRAEQVALAAIQQVSDIEAANAETRRPKPRPDRGAASEGTGTKED